MVLSKKFQELCSGLRNVLYSKPILPVLHGVPIPKFIRKGAPKTSKSKVSLTYKTKFLDGDNRHASETRDV